MASSISFTRRQVFKTSAAVGGAIAAAPLLSACGSGSTASKSSGVVAKSAVQAVLPTYKASTAVTPDIPGVSGANGAASDPAFLSYPATPPLSVAGAIGTGGSYQAVSPVWGSVPPAGNSYYAAVNQAIGAKLTDQPSDGNNYGTMLATRFASGNIPDWLAVPGWNVSTIQNFSEGVDKYFKDLTPFLAGDKILVYPNLAAIPTGGWQAGVWNGKLYGIPLWTSAAAVQGALFYRADIFKAAGVDPATVTSADQLKAVGKQVNNPSKGQYAFDDLSKYLYQVFNVPQNNGNTGWARDSSGKLVNGYEVPEFLEMLNFENSLAKAGLIHPDALAGDSSKAKNRFWAGKTVITGDGTGAWNKSDSQSGVAANPGYERQAFKVFAFDGGKATMPLYPGAGMSSYLSKSLSDDKVKELLRIADFLAAPFGSAEYLIARYGKVGTDYTMTGGAPILTDEGNKVVTDIFDQLANCQSVTFNAGYNQITKDYAAWQADMVQHATKPMFYSMNISEPPETAKASTALEAVITDVRMGRKGVADYQSALSAWQNGGGNQLRTFYEGIAKQYGTGN